MRSETVTCFRYLRTSLACSVQTFLQIAASFRTQGTLKTAKFLSSKTDNTSFTIQAQRARRYLEPVTDTMSVWLFYQVKVNVSLLVVRKMQKESCQAIRYKSCLKMGQSLSKSKLVKREARLVFVWEN